MGTAAVIFAFVLVNNWHLACLGRQNLASAFGLFLEGSENPLRFSEVGWCDCIRVFEHVLAVLSEMPMLVVVK